MTSITSRDSLNLPRTPVLGWASFRTAARRDVPSVQDLPHLDFTTSGRAALYQAILQMDLAAGSIVGVPTYHCPTMVAPIVRAGMVPAFYGIDAQGAPGLEELARRVRVHAIIVPHYFGLPRSLARVRDWCDRHRIALMEDCAHSLFGHAGERPVGAWGDYATASISKFLPVSEAGLLGSATRPLRPMRLGPRSLTAQVKGLVDVMEIAARHERLHGLNTALQGLFEFKNRRKSVHPFASSAEPPCDGDLMLTSDMDRVASAPLWVCRQLALRLPKGRVIARRRANFERYAAAFARVDGAHALMQADEAVAPYVFPLWVDAADRVYHALRAIGAPVFRWDRVWPGTPALEGDQGARWSRHVLQFLCHQDLSDSDIDRVADRAIELLRGRAP